MSQTLPTLEQVLEERCKVTAVGGREDGSEFAHTLSLCDSDVCRRDGGGDGSVVKRGRHFSFVGEGG